MTWLQALRAAIRSFLITRESENVVTDVINNGLTPEDITIIDTFLGQTMP
ncbi:hypothetical protein FDH38_gp020 [Dinoroseobacter phage vB_DshS-R5C]|uniref:PH domain-containing protein n=1 Tax=Dinoroseobacter phage vB_DshS-R5C TaxID=1965368 RepID=A0A1V0DY29_9CAUD|nr:hypothetical protein FDH38_gp020 [Dinoroseobacter phage vB_DshS-R5C]ARB06074.1 hypothetical protein vBDshSR5C_20 [Dinoroseobacter phage vB_DshS-R5C]